MTSHKVIVFGPTGDVGSAAAITAEELGVKVYLAMRDTSKPIPGLDAAKEKQGNFERIQADLTDPETISKAVKESGAKRAFFYLMFGAPDGMKPTVQALKSAGIELPVFLSSFTVREDLRAPQPSEVIPYAHAQVEINLQEIFGKDNYVAARPGSFASNSRQYKEGVKTGEVKVFSPDSYVDCIVPKDIGRVCGTVLAKGPQDEKRAIYLYGPELLTQKGHIEIIGKVLGKDLKVETATEEEARRIFVEVRKVPPPLVDYMMAQMKKITASENTIFGFPVSNDELSNVEKYSGKKATTFAEWVSQNKDVFLS